MKKFALIILSVFLAASCSGKEGNTPDWPWEDPEVVEPGKDDAEEDKWLDVSSQFGTLPDYLKVYRSAEKLEGKPVVAYIAVADNADSFGVAQRLGFCTYVGKNTGTDFDIVLFG